MGSCCGRSMKPGCSIHGGYRPPQRLSPHTRPHKWPRKLFFPLLLFFFFFKNTADKQFTLLSTASCTFICEVVFASSVDEYNPWLGTWLGKVILILFDDLRISRGYISITTIRTYFYMSRIVTLFRYHNQNSNIHCLVPENAYQ